MEAKTKLYLYSSLRPLAATICLLAAAFPAEARKPLPLGVYMLLPNKDPKLTTEPCWKDKNIVGVTLRLNWSDIESRGQGDFDWSYLDQGLALCQSSPSGKKYAVLAVNCGRETPQWVQGQTFTLHTRMKGTFTVVAPWDPNFQAELATFIAAFGQRYDSNPLVLGISIWAGGWMTECNFAESQQDTNTLNAPPYNGPAIWLNAAENAAADYAQAFPTTYCYISGGVPIIDGKVTMTTLDVYCQSLGMGVQSDELCLNIPWVAGDPKPTKNPNFTENMWPYTNLSFATSPSQVPLCRCQFLYPMGTSNPEGNQPMGTSLAAVLTNGLNAGATNIEIYPTDPTYGGNNGPAIAAFNKEVGAP